MSRTGVSKDRIRELTRREMGRVRGGSFRGGEASEAAKDLLLFGVTMVWRAVFQGL